MNSVATTGFEATVCTGILVITITVIAGLLPEKDQAIAAGGRRTIIETSILVIDVAIIATLPLLNDPITATRRLTVCTSIGGVFIAIVTALARTHDAVTTKVPLAIAPTGIVVTLVAVITGLVTGSSLAEILT